MKKWVQTGVAAETSYPRRAISRLAERKDDGGIAPHPPQGGGLRAVHRFVIADGNMQLGVWGEAFRHDAALLGVFSPDYTTDFPGRKGALRGVVGAAGISAGKAGFARNHSAVEN